MMIKKSLALLLAGLLLLPALAACGKTEGASTTPAVTDQPSKPDSTDAPATQLDQREAEKIATFSNPVLSSRKEGANLGDPFIMRYNGSYYLYVTSPGTGLHCWQSDNLAKWTYKGMCARESVSNGGYAPEVFYYNGKFYLYTSPNGNGHYVFVSDSPTGPFKVATKNIGMSIDGSVFIDNDGKWYFYTAGGNAIEAYTMSSPTKMQHSSALSSTSMSGWTEGPMVVYHDGYYYMTYTGNHFLSMSYRINYVTSLRSPLTFNASKDNPLLVSTSPEVHHIGHNSIFKGPDLDSYYIAYHSMYDNGNNRDVNIDRVVFNGNSMSIMGPTVDRQQVPDLPDVYAYFRSGDSLDGWTLQGELGSSGGMSLTDGSLLISNASFTGDYTAEYNVANIAKGAMAGALFSYTDANNFGACVFDPASQKVIITVTVDGKSTVTEEKMIQSFGEDVLFDCIQSIQIEKKGSDYTFYMNDRQLCKLRDCPLPGGAAGYIAQGGEATFGFIGITGAVGGKSIADDYKTVSELSGLIPADSYTTGSFPTEEKNKMDAVVTVEGNVLNYRVLASDKGNYDLTARYFTGAKDKSAVMEIYVDGSLIKEVTLAGSKSLTAAVVRDIPLSKGQHTLSIKIKSGNASFIEFTLLKSQAVEALELNYSAADGNVYTDGGWILQQGTLAMRGDPATGKRLYGHRNWGDYTVEAEVTPGSGMNAGLLVRATNPGTPVHTPVYSPGAASDSDANAGADWVQAYYISITQNSVDLIKQNYGYEKLDSAKLQTANGKSYAVKVVCQGATIQVYVDGELLINYTDSEPFMQGMVGVRTYQDTARFDNFKVSAIG